MKHLNYVLPKALCSGDTVGIIAPSSPLKHAEKQRLKQGCELLERWGLKVKLASNIESRHRYLCGDDAERFAASCEILLDPAVDAVCFLRGGYGLLRLLRHFSHSIDWSRWQPKRLVGLSDATVLLSLVQTLGRQVVFHGPNIGSSQLHDSPHGAENQHSLYQALCAPAPAACLALKAHNTAAVSRLSSHQSIHAPLLGGNLCLLAAMQGAPACHSPAGHIVLLEEVGEKPYRVDRLLTQLNNAGFFDQVPAVVLGDFYQCDTDDGLLMPVIQELFAQSETALYSGLPSGHAPRCLSVPLGLAASIELSEPVSASLKAETDAPLQAIPQLAWG